MTADGTAETAPHFATAALLTIDVQVDVLDGRPLEIPGTTRVLPAIVRLAQAFRDAERPIVHVLRLYDPAGGDVDRPRRASVRTAARTDAPILRPGWPGAELAPGIAPDTVPHLDAALLLAGGFQVLGPGEVAMWKPRWGAFYRTPLEEHLRGLGVDTLVFSGCNFPNCPRTSVYEASERDFRVALAVGAVSGAYDRGLDELAGIGVACMSVTAIVGALTR